MGKRADDERVIFDTIAQRIGWSGRTFDAPTQAGFAIVKDPQPCLPSLLDVDEAAEGSGGYLMLGLPQRRLRTGQRNTESREPRYSEGGSRPGPRNREALMGPAVGATRPGTLAGYAPSS
jgi:hypothetical protein